MTPTPGSPAVESSSKKPYNRPQLQVYGDLREITNTVTKTGSKTDGTHITLRSR